MRVSWSAPEQENGVLLGYTVTWSVKDMVHTLKVKNMSADQTDLLVTSLQVNYQSNSPYFHHFFKIKIQFIYSIILKF